MISFANQTHQISGVELSFFFHVLLAAPHSSKVRLVAFAAHVVPEDALLILKTTKEKYNGLEARAGSAVQCFKCLGKRLTQIF